MSRRGLILTCLLGLNACAVTPPPAPVSSPTPALDPVPAEQVVLLAPGTLPPDVAVPVATFTPTPDLEALSDTDLLKHYTVQAGQRGANRVSLHQVSGRRIVAAHYVRVSPSDVTVPGDSADAVRQTGGSSASPSGGGSVHVRGYYRRDGTYVRPHTRSRPGGGSRPRGSRRRGE